MNYDPEITNTRNSTYLNNVGLHPDQRRNRKTFDLQDKRKLYAEMTMPKQVYDKDFDTNYYDKDHELQ